MGAEVWKNTHGGLGSIYENEDDLAAELLPEQAETVNRGQVRNLNITSDAQRDPDQLSTYKFAEKTVDWDTHAGNNLPVLDGAMEPSKLEHMKLGTTIMPYGESLVNTQRIHEDDGAPKREETMLFDRHRARLGSPQHRLQGPRLDYVSYQQSRPLPELGYTAEMQEADRLADQDFVTKQTTKAFRAAALEKTLKDDKRVQAKRTAEFNFSAHRARLTTTMKESNDGGTDMLYTRPDTARHAIRAKNKEVAEFISGQYIATAAQKKRQEQESKDLDLYVATCARDQHIAAEKDAHLRRKAYQGWIKSELDRQVREGKEKAEAEYQADLREYPVGVPHFQQELNEGGFAIERRAAAKEAMNSNMQKELATLTKAKRDEEARIEEGRRMLAKAKVDMRSEMLEGVEQRKTECAKIHTALKEGTRRVCWSRVYRYTCVRVRVCATCVFVR